MKKSWLLSILGFAIFFLSRIIKSFKSNWLKSAAFRTRGERRFLAEAVENCRG